jgi:site-specific DNA-methyltransferase (adenine-specific)
VWVELTRVLRPAANVLIFGGSRTLHRLAVSLEDAGFVVLDVLM